MAFCDFMVKYDPKKDSMQDIAKRIIYSLMIRRIKNRKPNVVFISGDSGEGKSWGALRLQEVLMEIQGMDLLPYVNDINVYTPLEYPRKLESILFDKKLKKVNIICMHEAREVVKAKNWQRFLTQAVADINAMSRSVKRLNIIIISQFIRDITTDIRYTLNYYIKVRRPRGKPARMYISIMWKDDRDLEKPKLRKRKLIGYLIYPNGKAQKFMPKYLEVSRPNKELTTIFEKSDKDAKKTIIKRKLSKLMQELKADMGEESDKIKTMVLWYSTNTENLRLIGKRYKNKIRVSKDFREMHDITIEESESFEKALNIELIKQGVINEDQIK